MEQAKGGIASVVTATVQSVEACDLKVGAEAWAFQEQNKKRINAHWARARRDNPFYFNGAIHIMTAYKIANNVLAAEFFQSDFASFLYWRDHGSPPPARDGFGSAIIRSADGHLLLGMQRAGHINAGLAYPPGGLIDVRDVDAHGHIDIDGSIARELAEETGLDASQMERVAGYKITESGPSVSIAIEYRSHLPADELRSSIIGHIASETRPELEDIIVIRTKTDIAGLAMPDFASALVSTLV